MHKALVFTATYNEASNIGPWIEGVAKAVPDTDILIIDDSSPDHTVKVITEFAHTFPQVCLHSRAGKQGLSSAHIYAMQYALDNGYGALVTMDADGSHQAAQIPAVLGALRWPCHFKFLYRHSHPRWLTPGGSSPLDPQPRCEYHRSGSPSYGDQ